MDSLKKLLSTSGLTRKVNGITGKQAERTLKTLSVLRKNLEETIADPSAAVKKAKEAANEKAAVMALVPLAEKAISAAMVEGEKGEEKKGEEKKGEEKK